MVINVIHKADRLDRLELLQQEQWEQGFKMRLWDAIIDKHPQTGISKAHKQIVFWAKYTGQKEVCIAEDDVSFCGPGAYEYFLSNKPNDYDLYLGGIYKGLIREDSTVEKFSCLHLYIIHERFYKTFLKADEKENIDIWLGGKGKFVVCDPLAAIQHDTPSDNNKTRIRQENYLHKFRYYNGKTFQTLPVKG